ncbi:hypothetical protein LXL04_007800 [Taraxacum kok-saghyz]
MFGVHILFMNQHKTNYENVDACMPTYDGYQHTLNRLTIHSRKDLSDTKDNTIFARLRETVLRPLYGTDNPHLRWLATILTVDTSIVSDTTTLANRMEEGAIATLG